MGGGGWVGGVRSGVGWGGGAAVLLPCIHNDTQRQEDINTLTK